MDRPQMAGIVFGIAATIVGGYGLLHVKPLPLSAKLGEFAPLDRNQDGRLSEKEWLAAGRDQQAFTALDRNHDGLVEASEIPHKPRRSAE